MNYTKLSKLIAHALRHDPYKYGLDLDENGYVNIVDLIKGLSNHSSQFKDIVKSDIEYIIENQNKKRYEIVDNKIRALYGHSAIKIEKTIEKPPAKLFHGTSPQNEKIIISEGIKQMSRQYVHLSADINTAIMVGKRRCQNPIIFVIDAEKAWQENINFYRGEEDIWLCDYVELSIL